MIGMTLMALMPTLRWGGTLLRGCLLQKRRPHGAYYSFSTIHLPSRVGRWPLERISHLLRRRRIMETKQRICLLLAALLSLSGVPPAAATDYEASAVGLARLSDLSHVLPAAAADYEAGDYLPLAVGNSWTYSHNYRDHFHENEPDYGSTWTAYTAQFPEDPQFTIRVERTEVIDGKTYYVLSDMPANWPPAPPHFIAGKKLRWEGTHLMERTADGEQAIFRFDGVNKTGYEITTDQGDIRVSVGIRVFSRYSVPSYSFYYFVPEGREGESVSVAFLARYGLEICGRLVMSSDVPEFLNEIYAVRAVIGGRQVEYDDARRTPTSSSSSSWGQVKQSLFSHALEGRNSQ